MITIPRWLKPGSLLPTWLGGTKETYVTLNVDAIEYNLEVLEPYIYSSVISTERVTSSKPSIHLPTVELDRTRLKIHINDIQLTQLSKNYKIKPSFTKKTVKRRKNLPIVKIKKIEIKEKEAS